MSSVIGVVIIARHGDREGYYQSPSRYAPPPVLDGLLHELTRPGYPKLCGKRHNDHTARFRPDVSIGRRPEEPIHAWKLDGSDRGDLVAGDKPRSSRLQSRVRSPPLPLPPFFLVFVED